MLKNKSSSNIFKIILIASILLFTASASSYSIDKSFNCSNYETSSNELKLCGSEAEKNVSLGEREGTVDFVGAGWSQDTKRITATWLDNSEFTRTAFNDSLGYVDQNGIRFYLRKADLSENSALLNYSLIESQSNNDQTSSFSIKEANVVDNGDKLSLNMELNGIRNTEKYDSNKLNRMQNPVINGTVTLTTCFKTRCLTPGDGPLSGIRKSSQISEGSANITIGKNKVAYNNNNEINLHLVFVKLTEEEGNFQKEVYDVDKINVNDILKNKIDRNDFSDSDTAYQCYRKSDYVYTGRNTLLFELWQADQINERSFKIMTGQGEGLAKISPKQNAEKTNNCNENNKDISEPGQFEKGTPFIVDEGERFRIEGEGEMEFRRYNNRYNGAEMNYGGVWLVRDGSTENMFRNGESLHIKLCQVKDNSASGEKAKIVVKGDDNFSNLCQKPLQTEEREEENETSDTFQIEVPEESQVNKEIQISITKPDSRKEYRAIIESPDNQKLLTETVKKDEWRKEFTPEIAGEYTVKIEPAGVLEQVLNSLTGKKLLAQDTFSINPSSGKPVWERYCESNNYQNLEEKNNCIREEIVPDYFENSVGPRPEIAESLCTTIVSEVLKEDMSYEEDEKKCIQPE